MIDRDYELFATIVATGSLSAAGRMLHLSPAMVSKRLARLEDRLGATLIIRTTRRLALTHAGERFHQDVIAILDAVKAAEARVSGQYSEPSGPLRVSAPTSFGRLHIAPYVSRFLNAHPLVQLELNLSDSFIDLMNERTDIALRITADIGPGLRARRLATNRRILCAAPAYLERHGTPSSIRELRGHCLLAAEGQLPWRLIDAKRQTVSVNGESHVRTNSSEVVRELAIAGVGIAFRSLWDISHDLTRGKLIRILDSHEGSRDVGIFTVQPDSTHILPTAQAFSDFLAGLYAPVAPWETPA